MINVEGLTPPPLRFGRCARCPYLQGGSSLICYSCASRAVEQVAKSRCQICDQRVPPGGSCHNRWCASGDRYFLQNFSIAMMTGLLKKVIHGYKFYGERGWAAILGRVLAGYLDAHEDDWFRDFQLIVASPTYRGVGARHSWDHIAEVLSAASQEALGDWPFDDLMQPAIIKSQETPSMTKRNWPQRLKVAENELRAALSVPNPDRVAGKNILVFDDVFTDGMTLREVARALQSAGAHDVSQVTLARQPWRDAS